MLYNVNEIIKELNVIREFILKDDEDSLLIIKFNSSKYA